MSLQLRLFISLLVVVMTTGMGFAGDRRAKKIKTPELIDLSGIEVSIEGTLTYERARAYSLPSKKVLDVFEALAGERKIAFSQHDRDRGIFVSKWIPIGEKRFPGLDSPDEIIPIRVRYHVFIPQGIEPARVYINSELEARRRNGQKKMLLYNAGGLEHWLFTELEKVLAESGRALPRDPASRTELFETMVPGSTSGCSQTELLVAGIGNVSNPVLIEEFKVYPIFPAGARDRSARVALQSIVYEDGSVGDPVVIQSNEANPDFDTTSKHTTSFWRYEPARRGDCPVATSWFVIVEYMR